MFRKMIKISFLYDENAKIYGFDFLGHAEYAVKGDDIVCAAVSCLVFTTLNSIEKLTECGFTGEQNKEKGYVHFEIKKGESDEKSELLLNSLKLGVSEIQNKYGKKYINIEK